MVLVAYKLPLRTVAFGAMIFFASLLVWCGDADCLSGDGDADCSALVCSLLGKHTGEAGDSNSVHRQAQP